MARGKKYKLNVDGGSISRDDLNLIAASAATSEDNAVSSVIHVPPFPGGARARWIVGADAGSVVVSTVVGTVSIQPHTSMIGPADTIANVGVTAAGAAGSVPIPAGSGSGNRRYDLIYETVSIDNSDTAVYRKVKDKTDREITTTLFSNTTSNLVAYNRVAGAESTGVPALPTIPADPVGGFNIPLAYVYVSNAYAITDLIGNASISGIAPVIDIPGVARPMNKFSTLGGLISADITSATRAYFLPQEMSGLHQRFVFIDTSAGPADGAILDDSIDWSKRLFRTTGQLGTTPATGGGGYPAASGKTFSTVGNSFHNDPVITPARMVAARGDVNVDSSYSTNWVEIDVDSSGRLVLKKSGNFAGVTFFWLTASARYTNNL